MTKEEIIEAIRRELDRRQITPYRAAIRAGLPENAVRYVLEGRDCKTSRLSAICSSLGLELYIGPPRSRVTSEQSERETERRDLVDEIRSGIREDLAEALTQAIETHKPDLTAPSRQVEVRELAAAAGGGATELDERVVGFVSFQRSWLDREAIDPTLCTVISVSGDSMEPTLPSGSKILVDRSQRRQRTNGVYVVWTGDGLVVKRAKKNAAGQWLLSSDNPSSPTTRWPKTARVIGEVKWVGRRL